MPRFSQTALLLLFLLIAPVCAFAQDDAPAADLDTAAADVLDAPKTIEDNFGGAQLGLYFLAGAGRCDDAKDCAIETHHDETETAFQMNLDLEFSYLWGHSVFVGPAVHAHYRFYQYAGGDLRLKVVVPFNANNGLGFSIGWGWGLEMDQLIDDEVCNGEYCYTDNTNYDLPHGMYIPFQLAYDYVFDFGLMIGLSFEAQLTFNRILRQETNKTKVHPALGFIGGGIHLGYHF